MSRTLLQNTNHRCSFGGLALLAGVLLTITVDACPRVSVANRRRIAHTKLARNSYRSNHHRRRVGGRGVVTFQQALAAGGGGINGDGQGAADLLLLRLLLLLVPGVAL